MSETTPNADLQDAISQLKSAKELGQEIESVQQSVSRGVLKDLPKDIVRVQGYVIDVQRKAIDVLLKSLSSRDSIQEQLNQYFETMSMIASTYRTATESVDKAYKDKIDALTVDLQKADLVIKELKESLNLLEKRVRLLTGGGSGA